MKLLLDIPDQSASSVLELLKGIADITTLKLTAKDAATFQEIKHIKEAFKLADQYKAGKLRTMPAADVFK